MATYQEIFDAFTDTTTVRNRSIVAVSKFARYIAGGGGSPSADRLAWAKDALLHAEQWADRARWGLAGDPQFLADGASITDANLQTAVETALNAIIPA